MTYKEETIDSKLLLFWSYMEKLSNTDKLTPEIMDNLYTIFLANVRQGISHKSVIDNIFQHCYKLYSRHNKDVITTVDIVRSIVRYCNLVYLPASLVKDMEIYLTYYYVQKEPRLFKFLENL